MFRKSIYTFILLATAHFALGQSANSPYSIFGLGDAIQRGNVANFGMGGIGYAYAHPFFSSVKNPALLPISYLTIFDAGYSVERKWLNTTNENLEEQRQRDFAGNLNYFNLTFPIMPKGPKGAARNRWNMAIGLRPISLVNYDIEFSSRDGLENTEAFAKYQYTGNGGINEVHFSNGVQITKQFSVGMDINYVFGAINRISSTNLENTPSLYRIDLRDRSTFSDLSLTAAFAFTDSLYTNAERGHSYSFTIGGVFTPSYGLNSKRSLTFDTKDFRETPILSDTIESVAQAITMPAQLGGGIAISKIYNTKSKLAFTLGADATYTQWSNYTNNLRLNQDGESEQFEDVLDLSVGLEVIPDAGSVSNYLKRVIYRVGARYTTTPWQLADGTRLDEYQITAGISFPLLRQASAINFAAIYGWRGNDEIGKIREDYLRLKFGITINDRWFVKRKYY